MESQNGCIFPCRIWEIEDIQIAETVPCDALSLSKCSLPSQTTFSAHPIISDLANASPLQRPYWGYSWETKGIETISPAVSPTCTCKPTPPALLLM